MVEGHITIETLLRAEKSAHLNHEVLQLVIGVRNVRCRYNQQPPLFVELIQERRTRLHVGLQLHGYKHKVT